MSLQEQLLEYFIDFFENFTFFYVVFRKNFRRQSRQTISVITICNAVYIAGIVLHWELEKNITPMSFAFIICSVTLYCVFDVPVAEMIGLVLEEWLILSIVGTTVYIGIMPCKFSDLQTDNIAMLLVSGFLWLYYMAIGKRQDPGLFQLPVKVLYLLDFIMLILTFMVELLFYVAAEMLPEGIISRMGMVLAALGGSMICVLLLAMMYFYNRTKLFRNRQEIAEIHMAQQKEYFRKLLEKEEETRRFRHDIIDNLLEIQNYYEKQEYENLGLYLKTILGDIERISKKTYDVGNDIVNTVLNYYLNPLEPDYDIEVRGRVSERIAVEQRDLCIVVANVIKNAVEALEKLESGKLIFEINEGKQYLSIKVENTFDGIIKPGKDGLSQTTKNDFKNHGIGLQNVKEAIGRYEGTYHTDIKGNEYQVVIYLKIQNKKPQLEAC